MSNHRNIIDANHVALCQLTHSTDILIDTCTERNIFTREDKDVIENEEIPYKRNRIFYRIMRLKDEANFHKLVEIMKEENTAQSCDVLNILENNQPGPSRQKYAEPQNPVEPEGRSVWLNVHDPITSFVGRENELKELHEIVTRNADKDTQVAIMSQLSSVSGMGGIGKTTLAREYAKQYASYFNNNIIWINAETTTSTEESFRQLAAEITEKQNEKEVSISQATKGVYKYFSRRKCLFVFDNVEEYKSTVAPFIPKSYEPGKIRPYILMTSRKQRLVEDCKVLRLDILAIEDAEKFIKSKLQECMGQIDDESVRVLANELQCLPLALQQAIAYIRNQVHLKSFFPLKERNHVKEYLKLLEENPKIPLSHKYQDEIMDDYAYTVMRTWDVTLKAIEREEYGRQANEILEMLSYFPPEKIDIEEFNSTYSEEEILHSCVILEQYSLINRGRERECINIHRLVQQVIRVQILEKDWEEYILGRCLELASKCTKRYDSNYRYMYWSIWKYTLRYETLVIKFRSIIGNYFTFTNIKDLEMLNSSLYILEKCVSPYELVDPYVIFIHITLFESQSGTLPEGFPGCLAQKILTRLNALIELGHYDSIFHILDLTASCVGFQSVARTRIPKLARDVMQIISNYCYEHSTEVFSRHDNTPYYLIEFWLKFKELGQCRMCFKLLVLENGAESVNNIVTLKHRRPFFKNFCLFNKYLLQLGSISNKKELEFVREVLDFCRCLPLDAEEIERLEKIDVLLCNILCLLLLNYNFVHEILACAFNICVQMRNELIDVKEKTVDSELRPYIRYSFGRTMEEIICTLNSVVIVGTSSLVTSEWVHYVDKIIKFIGTCEIIMEIVQHGEESVAAWLLELEFIICELEDCCRWFVDVQECDNE